MGGGGNGCFRLKQSAKAKQFPKTERRRLTKRQRVLTHPVVRVAGLRAVSGKFSPRNDIG